MFIPHDHHVIVQPDASLRLRYTPTSGRRCQEGPRCVQERKRLVKEKVHTSLTPGYDSLPESTCDIFSQRLKHQLSRLWCHVMSNIGFSTPTPADSDSDVPAPGTSTT